MKAKMLCSLLFVVMLAVAPLELSARTLGMVADDNTNSVTVFDADTHAVLGTVPIPESFIIGDVVITPDLKRGLVSSTDPYVTVIDLTTSPPSLAGGTNPIPIETHFAQDVTVSPNGKFLLVTDGFTDPVSQPISVIDIAAQAEVSTFFTDEDFSSSDFCNDSSVLVTANDIVRHLTLSGGALTDTGEALSVTEPSNVYCAPGGQSGVVIHRSSSSGQEVTSFTVPGLSSVDTRSLSGLTSGLSGAINASGNRVFVRSNDPGSIDVFDFNPASGALGADPLLTIPVADAARFFIGMEQLALHPNGKVVFVPEPGKVNVYDSNTGTLLASITDPNIVQPTGVTVVAATDPCALPPPAGAIVGTNGPDQINGTSGNDTIFGLGGADQINGGRGNNLICGGDGNDQINGNAGNDTLHTQDGVGGNDSANGGAGNDVCTGDPGDALSSCNP